MAEVLGIVTAIGSIVTCGFKLSRTIADAADEFGAAGTRVRSIAIDTKAVAVSLRQIRSRLRSKDRPLSQRAVEVLREIVTQCRTDIDEIEACLMPLIAKAGEVLSRKQRFRWLFAKSKIAGKQAALNSLKLTLSLFIHTMEFEDEDDVE